MRISKIKPLTSQYHSVGGSRGAGFVVPRTTACLAYYGFKSFRFYGLKLDFMSYVTFYAIVTTSGPMVEHINGSRRYWNFMELYVWGKSSGTLWNFIMGLMERNNYDEK